MNAEPGTIQEPYREDENQRVDRGDHGSLPEPGAEEGGEDIFEMPKECIRYDCAHAPLVNEGAFRVCSKCGASYGEALSLSEQDG